MENLLNEYMIDEESFAQETLDEKYLDSDDEAPDFIYLQEQIDEYEY
jgi:hypothetical protein